MHMFGHHDVAVHAHAIQDAGSLKRGYEQVAGRDPGEVSTPPVTRKRDEMRQLRMMETLEPGGHGNSLVLDAPQLPEEGNCGPPAQPKSLRLGCSEPLPETI